VCTNASVVPKSRGTPGRIAHAGLPLGKHNQEIYGGLLAKTEAEMKAFVEPGVI
jgi:hypothetical protein